MNTCHICGQSANLKYPILCDRHLKDMIHSMFTGMNDGIIEHPDGSGRLIYQCKCGNYEIVGCTITNEKGIDGNGIIELGWRKINGKWDCFDCLLACN